MGKWGLCFKTSPLCPLLSTPQLCPCRGGAVAGECGQPGGRGPLRACDKGFGSAEPRGRLVLLLLTEALQRWCSLPAWAQPPGTPCERAPEPCQPPVSGGHNAGSVSGRQPGLGSRGRNKGAFVAGAAGSARFVSSGAAVLRQGAVPSRGADPQPAGTAPRPALAPGGLSSSLGGSARWAEELREAGLLGSPVGVQQLGCPVPFMGP